MLHLFMHKYLACSTATTSLGASELSTSTARAGIQRMAGLHNMASADPKAQPERASSAWPGFTTWQAQTLKHGQNGLPAHGRALQHGKRRP